VIEWEKRYVNQAMAKHPTTINTKTAATDNPIRLSER
jgi:hypothetical protein